MMAGKRNQGKLSKIEGATRVFFCLKLYLHRFLKRRVGQRMEFAKHN